MLKLHVTKSVDGDLITLSKHEFFQLVTIYKQYEPVSFEPACNITCYF